MEQGIGIKDLIRTVTRELRESQQEREKSGEPVLFRTKDLEIEVSFVVEAHGGADAKFKVWIVSVGASAGVKAETVHRLKLRFTAEGDPPGKGSGTRPLIDIEEMMRKVRESGALIPGSAPSIGDEPDPDPPPPAKSPTFPFPDHGTPDGSVPGKYPGNPLGGGPSKPGPGGGGIPPFGGGG
jgi:hypothetical protein